MKTSYFILACAVLMLSSCSKDYDCTCTKGTESYTYDLRDVRKNDVDEACNLAGEVWITSGGSCLATEVE